MSNKYQQYPAYQSMKDAGMSERKILEEIKNGEEALFLKISDSMLVFLTARNLGIDAPRPNEKSKFTINKITTLSQIKDMVNGSIVNVKGRIIKVYDDGDHLSVIFTDMRHSIRCVLFNNAIDKFNNLNFEFGDKIKVKNVIVKTYKNKKELTGNDYTNILKLKDKVNKVNILNECN